MTQNSVIPDVPHSIELSGRGFLLAMVRSSACVVLVAFGTVLLIAVRELNLTVGVVFPINILISEQLISIGMPP